MQLISNSFIKNVSFAELSYHVWPREGSIELFFLYSELRDFGRSQGRRKNEREETFEKCKGMLKKREKERERGKNHKISANF